MASRALHRRRETLAGALIIALSAVVFLWRPLVAFGDGVFTPADFSQSYALTRVDEGATPHNPALEQAWAQNQAALLITEQSLLRGDLPAWNGFVGAGVPHLANPYTAVFSPFSWPYYALELDVAALLAAFAKLFVLGFATFLFLCERRLSFAASLMGAITFMFAGHEVTSLFESHSSTVFVLPAGLFLIERIAREIERSILASRTDVVHRPRLMRPAIGLALALALGFFGGAIPTFVFSSFALAAYAVLRLGSIAWRERDRATARRTLLIALAHIAGAAFVAALIAAIQALPYLEYVRNARGVEQSAVEVTVPSWPLFLFPNLLGHPSGVSWFGPGFPAPDYATFIASYVGVLPLLLAVVACATMRGARATWFFAALAVLALLCGGGVLGGLGLSTLLPAEEIPGAARAFFLFAFAASVLAALGLDRITTRGVSATPAGALTIFAASIGAILFARAMAVRLFEYVSMDPRAAGDRVLHQLDAAAHLDFVVATFVVGTALLLFACTAPSPRARSWLSAALIALVYFQTGRMFADYNTVTSQRHVYPRTTDIDRRDGTVGIQSALVLADVDVPPLTNAVYGLRSFAVNDPLRVRRHDQLQRRLFSPAGEFGLVTSTTRHALEVFGIECLFDVDSWIDVDTAFSDRPLSRAVWQQTEPILPGAPVSQYFRSDREGLSAVRFLWVTEGAPNSRGFEVTVDDLDTGQRHVGVVYPERTIRPDGRRVVPCVVPFSHVDSVLGHSLLLRITATLGADGSGSFSVGCRTDLNEVVPDWRATQGERVLDGQLALDLHYAHDSFVRQDTVGPFGLFRYVNATQRFRTVGSASVVASDSDSWARVLDPAFDAGLEVVLEAAPSEIARTGTKEDELDARLEVLDDWNGHVRLVVERRTPGFVVTPIAWYPGWRARVNNRPAQPLCANYAFTAVAVPPGESLVELEFAPKSLRNGIVLTILGLVALLVAFATTLPPLRSEVRA